MSILHALNTSKQYGVKTAIINIRVIIVARIGAAFGGLLSSFDQAIISVAITNFRACFGLDGYSTQAVSSMLTGCRIELKCTGSLESPCTKKHLCYYKKLFDKITDRASEELVQLCEESVSLKNKLGRLIVE